jgi:benzodiazapine receptor
MKFLMNKTINLKSLLGCIAIPLAAGLVSSFLAPNTKAVYAQLIKPPLSPPSWVFPVVWTILYILMGIAFCIIKDSKNSRRDKAIKFFYIQLAINVLWSPVFFSLQLYFASLIILLVLWVTVLITTIRFRIIDTTAGNLLIPYLIWLTFAAYLNMGIACLN